MNLETEIALVSFGYFLFLTGISGLIISFILLFKPETLLKIEQYLSQKILSSDPEGHSDIDSFRMTEHVFFNHHIKTGIFLIIIPSILLYLLKSLPAFNIVTEVKNNYLLPFWIFFFKTILLSTSLLLFKITSFVAILSGFLMLKNPSLTFRFMRLINKKYITSIPYEIILRNNKRFGVFILISSTILLYLLCKMITLVI